MITNTDVFHALKTLQIFCRDQISCKDCPLSHHEKDDLCYFEGWGTFEGIPTFWDVESLRPILDPASATLDH